MRANLKAHRVLARGRAATALTLLSSHHAPPQNRLSIETLGGNLAKASQIDLASAYYDVEFCKRLFAFAPPRTAVRLVFNGLGGARLRTQQQELVAFRRALRNRVSSVDIHLAFEPGIFHTKLLLTRSPRGSSAFVGSANATMAAMTINEELLVQLPGSPAFNDYFERIWNTAVPIDTLDDRLAARSLIAFFRTGSLYFKPTTTLQTTLNPFTDLLAGLSDAELKKLAVPLPHADLDAGIGAFNLERALGLHPDDRTKTSIKPFAVETCFGYWVPGALDDDLRAAFARAEEVKRRRWLGLKRAIDRAGDAALRARYEEYVESVRNLLVENRVKFTAVGPIGRNAFGSEGFEAFLDRIKAALANRGYLQRLCMPFIQGPMPELWDDRAAYTDFRQTFFEYLSYVADRPGKHSRVPATILRRAGVRGPVTPEMIESSLVRRVKTSGWRDEDWKGTR